MVFWLAVLVGALFAWIAVRTGFYAAWIMFFHLLLAACVSIFLTPVFVAGVPAAASIHGFGHALTLMSIAVATLFIGYGTCYACLSGRLQMPFPRFLDSIGAGVLGFLTGFLVWSFLLLAFTLTPVAQFDLVKQFGFDRAAQQTNIAYLCWWCDSLHYFVSPWGDETTSQQAIDLLMTKTAPTTEETPEDTPPEAPPPAPAVDSTATSYSDTAPAQTETSRANSQVEPKRLPSDFPMEPLTRLNDSEEKHPQRPAVEENSSDGPLAGAWASFGGAQFHIDDDGQTLTIELVASDLLQSLTGRLVRRNKTFITGNLEVVFKANPAKGYMVDVTGTIPDSRHLRLRCANWPKWNNQGKYLGKDTITEIWTRGHGIFADPFSPR